MQCCGSNFFHTEVVVPQLWTQRIIKIQCGLLIQMYRKQELNFVGFKYCDWQTVLEEDNCKMCKLKYRSSPIGLFAEWWTFRVRNVINRLKITSNNWLKCYKQYQSDLGLSKMKIKIQISYMKGLCGVLLCLIQHYIELAKWRFLEGFRSSLKHALFGFVFLSCYPS